VPNQTTNKTKVEKKPQLLIICKRENCMLCYI
jgi:hypothetical protein